MKLLFILLLLIPNLSLGDEKEARKLFVDAELESQEAGCSVTDFKSLQGDISLFLVDNVFFEVTHSSKMDLYEKIYPTIGKLKKCWKVYKEIVQPKYTEIVKEHSDTTVAYDLVLKNNYLSENDILETDKRIDKLLDELEMWKNTLSKEEYQEITNPSEEPLTNEEIKKLQTQLQGCLKFPTGINLKDEGTEITAEITVNRDRTVKTHKIANYGILDSPSPKLRAMYDAVNRVFNNPDCEVLELPVGKYNQWKEINFIFDFKWIFK